MNSELSEERLTPRDPENKSPPQHSQSNLPTSTSTVENNYINLPDISPPALQNTNAIQSNNNGSNTQFQEKRQNADNKSPARVYEERVQNYGILLYYFSISFIVFFLTIHL